MCPFARSRIATQAFLDAERTESGEQEARWCTPTPRQSPRYQDCKYRGDRDVVRAAECPSPSPSPLPLSRPFRLHKTIRCLFRTSVTAEMPLASIGGEVRRLNARIALRSARGSSSPHIVIEALRPFIVSACARNYGGSTSISIYPRGRCERVRAEYIAVSLCFHSRPTLFYIKSPNRGNSAILINSSFLDLAETQ